MIYIRKIFKQDLRDGKQIAFPKEASNVFFNFNYQNNDPDKLISFTFKDLSSVFNNTVINTRLYPAGSESRIDSELKRFLIDKLNVVIDDLIIFTKKDDKKYEFQHVPKNSSLYDLALNLLRSGNHQVLIYDSENNFDSLINDIQDSSLRGIVFKTFKFLISHYSEALIIKSFLEKSSKLDDRTIKVLTFPDYFKNDSIISYFEEEQTKDQLKSGITQRYFEENLNLKDYQYSYFTNQWYDNIEDNTSLVNFNRFLNDKSNGSLKIIKEDNIFKLIKSETDTAVKLSNKNLKNTNIIYYGAPGTGKSYKVDHIIKDLDKQFYERVTFHPEYDNASFIGGYKPISVEIEKDKEGEKNIENHIQYKFVPQAFANIYKRAWKDLDNQYYIVIEEINRGNCAEIFGELFQLLDRNSGYTVAPSNELFKHLVEEFGNENHEGIAKGLKLPPNLAILATMNTSDQSLFPMDSAFKRRWEWEYVPICYEKLNEEDGENKSYNFIIDLENGTKYSWIKFIEFINLNHIKENPNLGMDKCIGNYFVKPEDGDNISLKQFINKVVFYLWNDVFKDEDNAVFEENSSYEDFFPITTKGLTKVSELFDRISLNKIEDKIKEESSIDLAAEPQETYGE